MRGYIEQNGSYYEADHQLSADDIAVPLRPSDAHTLGPRGQWILDRRQMNRAPTPREYAEQAYGNRATDTADSGPPSDFGPSAAQPQPQRYSHQHMPMPGGYPYQAPQHMPTPQSQNGDVAVRQTLFDFIARNWITVGGILVWIVGSSWTIGTKFYDMQGVQDRQTEAVKNLQEEIKTIRIDLKEQKDKAEIMNKNNESRYNDLTVFLQTIARDRRDQSAPK